MPYNHRGREPRNNRLEVRLTDSELASLDQTCVRLDRTASVIVRLALAAFVEGPKSHAQTADIHNTPAPTGHRPSS